MADVADRVEFPNVYVIAADEVSLTCRVGVQVINVDPHRTLPGTESARRGDHGYLVLQRQVAVKLGLA